MIQIDINKALVAGKGNFNLKVDFTISEGQLVALYGPSGSGKTSVIRIIAGLMTPDSGSINVDGNVWFDKTNHINLTPQQRDIGIVFQDYALFPHMTVLENVSYALQQGQSKTIVDEILNFMELTALGNTRPHLLSGGQKQRVALARAIVRRPRILLLDEPTSALDTSLRLRMQEYIGKVHKQFKLTTLLISHDILEVARLSSHVFQLEDGLITKEGTPRNVLPMKELSAALKVLND